MANFTNLAGVGIVAALLTGAPAFAQDVTEWDGDTDGALSLEEFQEGFSQRVDFTTWDTDSDGMVSETEFNGAFLSRYDLDTTDAIEEPEIVAIEEDFGEEGLWAPDVTDVEIVDSEGAEVVEGEAEFVGAWDIDGDGVILREEFENGLRGFGTFAAFDADSDGNVTEEEFTQGIFARYDADATGIIEEPELGDIGDDMGDEGFWDV